LIDKGRRAALFDSPMLTVPSLAGGVAAAGLIVAVPAAAQNPTPPGATWPVHAMDRPRPPVVDPGSEPPPAPPPNDAVVLFGGATLEAWTHGEGGAPARWTVRDGAMEVNPGAGGLRTRRAFGDIQLHIEWSAPVPARGEGQERGNSGVFLMGLYEVQVLDSWRNDTYPDGQAGALYGQAPPLVNAVRPPGQWNAYDIVFRRPRFATGGELLQPARVTVVLNGIVIHNNAALQGRTAHGAAARYAPHEDRLPLSLQDHGDRVRFRNIWVRELPEQP